MATQPDEPIDKRTVRKQRVRGALEGLLTLTIMVGVMYGILLAITKTSPFL